MKYVKNQKRMKKKKEEEEEEKKTKTNRGTHDRRLNRTRESNYQVRRWKKKKVYEC